MICPRCSVAAISPTTGACDLCGYVPEGGVAVAPHPDATDERARLELAHAFRFDVLLGQGHGSAVYLVREAGATGHIVLKVLPRPGYPDAQADDRFRRAMEVVASLDHPHIVPVQRFGSTDSLFWYTMDHVRARSLREILRSRGPMDLRNCQRLATQVASALDYLHRRDVVHGDLKPENVLIDPNGWVHVCDALVTRAIGDAPASSRKTPGGTRRVTPAGTGGKEVSPAAPAEDTPRRPDYLAPEDHEGGHRTARSDQYALAVLVHEMLAGTPPSAGVDSFEPSATLESLRPDLPPHVTHAVRRALSPQPGNRFPGILDFTMQLETATLSLTDAQPSGRASDVVLSIPDWQPPKRGLPPWLTPVGVIIAMVLAAWFVVPLIQRWRIERQWSGERTPAQGPRAVPARALPRVAAPSPDSVTPATAAVRPDSGATATRAPAPARPAGVNRGTAPRRAPSTGRTAAPPPAETPAETPARLFVNATPWGQVFVDGQPIGNTPRVDIAIPPGTHTIRIVRDGFAPYERTIEAGAGEAVRLTGIVLQPRTP